MNTITDDPVRMAKGDILTNLRSGLRFVVRNVVPGMTPTYLCQECESGHLLKVSGPAAEHYTVQKYA